LKSLSLPHHLEALFFLPPSFRKPGSIYEVPSIFLPFSFLCPWIPSAKLSFVIRKLHPPNFSPLARLYRTAQLSPPLFLFQFIEDYVDGSSFFFPMAGYVIRSVNWLIYCPVPPLCSLTDAAGVLPPFSPPSRFAPVFLSRAASLK